MSPNVNEMPFEDGTVFITNHAVARIQERWTQVNPDQGGLKKPLKTIKRMLRAASPAEMEIPAARKVKQLIDHDFRGAQYYENRRWIFVVVQDKRDKKKYVLVTVTHPDLY